MQIKVAPESRELQIMSTNRGLCQHTRLRFDVKTARGIFQQIMAITTSDPSDTTAYLDDIVVVISHSQKKLQERIITQLRHIQE